MSARRRIACISPDPKEVEQGPRIRRRIAQHARELMHETLAKIKESTGTLWPCKFFGKGKSREESLGARRDPQIDWPWDIEELFHGNCTVETAEPARRKSYGRECVSLDSIVLFPWRNPSVQSMPDRIRSRYPSFTCADFVARLGGEVARKLAEHSTERKIRCCGKVSPRKG